jgi:hypothetical protein
VKECELLQAPYDEKLQQIQPMVSRVAARSARLVTFGEIMTLAGASTMRMRMTETELIVRTAPRQRLVLRALPAGIILESQSVMHDAGAHGWACILQHHIDMDQAAELLNFLETLTCTENLASAEVGI